MPLELKVLFIVLTILCACSAIALLIGVIAKKQELCLKVIKAIKAKVGDMPLVLHGGTGIPAHMIQKAISLGVCKINVNTECQLAFQEETRKYIELNNKEKSTPLRRFVLH